MQELSMNILDIAENSVKAGASLVKILLEYGEDSTLLLKIEDDGSGMDKEVLERVTNPFFTSRTTRKVGLGVPFLKMAAEMTGGSFSIESETGKGTVVTALFHTDHIDFVPLGDMGSTVSVLISANAHMDFIYTIRRNGNEFVLDSREIKGILDGVPADSPEVAVFIREYTEENSRELFAE